MKKGLIFSLYSPGREEYQKELEESLKEDMKSFDFLTLPPASSVTVLPSVAYQGYSHAHDLKYEFVARIDDDDLTVPGAFTRLMDQMEIHTDLAGCAGVQIAFKDKVPSLLGEGTPKMLKNVSHLYHHASKLFRTSELFPAIESWKHFVGHQESAELIKTLTRSGKVIGHYTAFSHLWRRR